MKLKPTSTNLGISLICIGTIITAYHTAELVADKFKGTKIRSHISFALLGLVTFSIGCNLVADGLHDHLAKAYA
jgi:hypothetical protein